MARQENPRIVAGNLNISQKFEIQAHRHTPSTRAVPSSSSSTIRKTPKSQAQKKTPNPLAAMHVLVDPLEIIPGRGGPPALRSRVPSILEALRAVSQPRLEGAAEEVPPESAHGNRASSPACCIPRGTGQSFAIRKKKIAGQELVKASSMACRERLGVQSQ